LGERDRQFVTAGSRRTVSIAFHDLTKAIGTYVLADGLS
jgi:hypothetical protein